MSEIKSGHFDITSLARLCSLLSTLISRLRSMLHPPRRRVREGQRERDGTRTKRVLHCEISRINKGCEAGLDCQRGQCDIPSMHQSEDWVCLDLSWLPNEELEPSCSSSLDSVFPLLPFFHFAVSFVLG